MCSKPKEHIATYSRNQNKWFSTSHLSDIDLSVYDLRLQADFLSVKALWGIGMLAHLWWLKTPHGVLINVKQNDWKSPTVFLAIKSPVHGNECIA